MGFDLNTLILLLIAFVSSAFIFLIIAIFSKQLQKLFDPLFEKHLIHLEQEFSLLDMPMTPRRFLLFQIGLTILLVVVGIIVGTEIITRSLFAVVFPILGIFSTKLYITIMKKQRRKKFDEQFVDAISLISNAVKSGLSLMQSLELAVQEMPDPISYEVNLVIQTTRLGIAIDVALGEWAERMASPDLDIFVTAVVIQRQTGGNLSDILDILASTIRQRYKIQGQIKALTAQGITSAYFLVALPIILGIVLYIVQPETTSLLFTHKYGLMMVAGSALMMSIGAFIVKKIVTIDI